MVIRVHVGPARALFGPISAALLLAVSTVQAQTTPSGVTLACASPTSTGNTASLDTAASVWGVDIGSGVTPAAAYFHGSPWIAGPVGSSGWIGAVTGTDPTSVRYSLQVTAADPNIVLGSAQITYAYSVDNTVTGITWNGSALSSVGGDYATTTAAVTAPVTLANGGNTLLFTTTNAGNPYGLNAKITLTYDCQLSTTGVSTGTSGTVPVPVDDPVALAALMAALGVAGAMAVRRRRQRQG
jgi:MYXO-CTERM domain-containing protein